MLVSNEECKKYIASFTNREGLQKTAHAQSDKSLICSLGDSADAVEEVLGKQNSDQ